MKTWLADCALQSGALATRGPALAEAGRASSAGDARRARGRRGMRGVWLLVDLQGASQNWVSVPSPVLGIRHASSSKGRDSGLSGSRVVSTGSPAALGDLEHVSRPRAALALTGRALTVEAAVTAAFLLA